MASGYPFVVALEAPATYRGGTEMSTCKVWITLEGLEGGKRKKKYIYMTNFVSSQRFDLQKALA